MIPAADIRAARAGDLGVLRRVYADAVRSAGPTAYTQGQVRAWSRFAEDAAFADFVLGVHTYVAEEAGSVVGFCGIADDGHVASVYVRGDRIGQGIGKSLLRHALAAHPQPASGRYYAEASRLSLPLFRRCGFRETGRECVIRDGETFERFHVELPVGG
jgi:putative acetyltransferase